MENTSYKGLLFVAMLMTTIMIISILVAYKPVAIGSLTVPGGMIGFPLVFTISDIVAEVYGYQQARRVVWFSICCSTLFTLISLGVVNAPSPLTWHSQVAYNTVFSHFFRVLLAVIFGVTTSIFINLYLFAKWKIYFGGRLFWFRCFAASSIGEIAVTLIAAVTAFMGTMSLHSLIHLILSVYEIKVIYSLIASFPAALVASYLKGVDNVDYYDHVTNFNPFKL